MDDAITLLRLQMEWGADEALEVEALNRLRTHDSAPPEAIRPTASSPAGASLAGTSLAGSSLAGSSLAGSSRAASGPLGPNTLGAGAVATGVLSAGVRGIGSATDRPLSAPADRAAAVAGQALSLEALREAVDGFDGCALRDTAGHTVFAEGDVTSKTLIIGEPPGREEDRSGHPFAGPDGVLLDQMLGSIGIDRGRLLLTPLIPWRPPGGRPPNATEVAICLPFLLQLIVLQRPRRLVLFSGLAARVLLSANSARRRTLPAWLECSPSGLSQSLPTLSLPSLADMQKTLMLRRGAWAGLRLLRRALESDNTQT